LIVRRPVADFIRARNPEVRFFLRTVPPKVRLVIAVLEEYQNIVKVSDSIIFTAVFKSPITADSSFNDRDRKDVPYNDRTRLKKLVNLPID
jgi:hypothetical protein